MQRRSCALKFELYREFFRAPSSRTRFSIVQFLKGRPDYVNEIAVKLGVEQSRISHSLSVC
jgi:DNA-binding transcriptional ArsR family regulator